MKQALFNKASSLKKKKKEQNRKAAKTLSIKKITRDLQFNRLYKKKLPNEF